MGCEEGEQSMSGGQRIVEKRKMEFNHFLQTDVQARGCRSNSSSPGKQSRSSD